MEGSWEKKVSGFFLGVGVGSLIRRMGGGVQARWESAIEGGVDEYLFVACCWQTHGLGEPEGDMGVNGNGL